MSDHVSLFALPFVRLLSSRCCSRTNANRRPSPGWILPSTRLRTSPEVHSFGLPPVDINAASRTVPSVCSSARHLKNDTRPAMRRLGVYRASSYLVRDMSRLSIKYRLVLPGEPQFTPLPRPLSHESHAFMTISCMSTRLSSSALADGRCTGILDQNRS